MGKFAPIIIVLAILVLLTLGGGIFYYTQKKSTPPVLGAPSAPASPVACSQEPRQCPNGSYVSRVPPNCEFAACPQSMQLSTTTPEAISATGGIYRGWQTYIDNTNGYSIQYPAKYKIVTSTVGAQALDIFADTEQPYPFAKPLVAISSLGTGYKAGAIPYVLGMDLGFLHGISVATRTIAVAGFSGQAAVVNDGRYNNFAIYVFYGQGRMYQARAVYNVPGDRLRPVNSGSYSRKVTRKFAEFVRDDWSPVVLPTLKYATQEHYRYLLRVHLLPAFGRLELRDISREAVQSFLNAKLKTNLSWKSVKHLRGALGKVMRTALDWGYVEENPVRKTKLPRPMRKSEKAVLEPLEIRQLLHALREPSRSVASLLVLTGVRIGELLALRWRDVDLHARVLRVRESVYDGHFDEPKSKSSRRTIPLGPQAVAILENRRPKAVRPDALVFTTRRGTPLSRRNLLRRQLRPVCNKLRLTGVNWHSLRHSNATLLDVVGTPLGTVQALLGHSSSEVTREIYLHSLPAGAREAVEKIEELVVGPKLDSTLEPGKTAA